jgi:glycosyltransferase involved in cell wall biosynthesis
VKIAFISRASLFTNRGGDTVQVMQTANWLQKMGVEVDIRLCNEKIDYENYDLLHFFNLIRPADFLYHIRKSRKPYVLSTIFVDYHEYDRFVRSGLSGAIFRMLPSGFIEYLKVIARYFANGEKIVSPEYLFFGHRRSMKKIISNAALILPNSANEYNRLLKEFGISKPFRIIPNAIDPDIFTGSPENQKEQDTILCVGRIEGLKNQINLIRALNDTPYHLYLIGAASANHSKYYEECRKEAGPNVFFVDAIPQQELVDYYRRARVHVLPSWFETTGLSSLEAAAMGCNVVITDKGDTREYFEDMAFYCDPSDPDSIRRAVETAAAAPVNERLRKKVREAYNWQEAALKTREAYQFALTEKKS